MVGLDDLYALVPRVDLGEGETLLLSSVVSPAQDAYELKFTPPVGPCRR